MTQARGSQGWGGQDADSVGVDQNWGAKKHPLELRRKGEKGAQQNSKNAQETQKCAGEGVESVVCLCMGVGGSAEWAKPS